jgi:DNA-directed RNA polymerase subunit RPC12/RpoP
MTTILRVYTRPEEIGKDGYPLAWHKCPTCLGDGCSECGGEGSAKDLIRALAGHRCVRCGHPYVQGRARQGRVVAVRRAVHARRARRGFTRAWATISPVRAI